MRGHLRGACPVGLHPAAGRAGPRRREVLRRPRDRRHRDGRPTQRQPQRGARSAQRGLGGTAGHPPGRTDPEHQVRRGHRHRHLPLHLASAQEPDVDLRRPAADGARRGALGGAVGSQRAAPQAGGASDVRAAGRPAAAGLGERTRRQRRAGAGLPVSLHAGRHPSRIRADRDGARDRGRPAPVQQHAQRSAAAGRAGQLRHRPGGSGDAASRRQRQGRSRRSAGCPASWSHPRPTCCRPTRISRRPSSAR